VKLYLYLCLVLFLSGFSSSAADFYVSPNPRPGADGSINDPWPLAKALNGPPIVQPGDTIWIREGVYNAAFISRLKGTQELPIVVRGYPGERVILDGNGIGWQKSALRVEGSWTWFRDFEITNSNAYTFGHARSHSVEIYGPHTKLINLVIYGTGQGPGFWTQSVEAEIYGCIVFQNGWLASDRGHGHGIYTQNDTGLKQVRDSILFNHFGYNFHAYGSSNSRINNYLIKGNVFFNGDFLAGGNTPALDIRIEDNAFYRAPVGLGYGNPYNKNLVFANNIVGSHFVARFWEGGRIHNNTFVPFDASAQDPAMALYLRPNGDKADFDVDENIYTRGPAKSGIDFAFNSGEGVRSMRFAGWQAMGYDSKSRYLEESHPDENQVLLNVNEYDPNRAHLVIFNWRNLDEVEVDFSRLNLQPGDEYEIRNVQNFFEEAMTGSYDGNPVKVPMNMWTNGKPILMHNPQTDEDKPIVKPNTFPEFGAFLVRWHTPNTGK
jgi:hypothetical protein